MSSLNPSFKNTFANEFIKPFCNRNKLFMKTKKLLFVLLMVPMSCWTMAQTKLSGVIYDQDNYPLPGASIFIKGTTTGTVSDVNGNFMFETPQAEGTMVVSFIGMQTVEKAFSSSQNFTITMQSELTTLNDVVVIGYGTSKKSDLTSAVSVASNIEQISSRPVANTQDFLQGNIAGVTVTHNGGDPTSEASVTIRGAGSINNESPLWVVDGMPYYGKSINPGDIESITVLKDASAAAIYGAQAASGVILVTTKSGKAGKLRVSFDAYSGVSQAMNLPQSLTATEQNEAITAAALNDGYSNVSDAFNAEKNPYGAVTRTDWIDEIFRSASLYNATLSISGGSEKGKYSASFGYEDRQGLLIATSSKRYSMRLKSEFNVNDHIILGQNTYLTYREAIGTNTSSSYSGAIINAIYMPRSAAVYEDGGTYMGPAPAGTGYASSYGDVYNPVALLKQPTIHNPVTNIDANVYGDLKLFEGFKFRSSFTLNQESEDYKKFVPKITYDGNRHNDDNYLYQSWNKRNQWIWDNQISYTKTFGLNKLDFTGVHSAQYAKYEYNYVKGQGFTRENEDYQYMVHAADITEISSDAYEDVLTSVIGRLIYSYNEKYFLSASIRRDQTSRLSNNNKTDFFPSVSVAWDLSKESFLSNSTWINQLKLRGSWGQMGNINSVGYYASNIPMGVSWNSGTVSYYIERPSNENLKWETSESYNIGLDLSTLKGKLDFTADYYQKYTYDMIMEDDVNPLAGAKYGAYINAGDVKNTGIELSLAYKGRVNDLHYSVNANISHVENELLNLDGSGKSIFFHDNAVRSVIAPYASAPGEELYSYYLIPNEGTFKSQEEIDNFVDKDGNKIQPNAKPGDLKFTDVNKDGSIDSDDKKFMGNAFPDFTYGINLSVSYKEFDLSMVFQGVSGSKIFNGYKYTTYNAGIQRYNLDNRVLEAWSSKHPNSNIPRLSKDDPNGNFGTESDWYLEDGSYLRMKNLTIGYNLPNSIMDHVCAGSSLRVYFSCDNVFTITDYSGLDPEVGGIGLDVAKYPVARTISGGISFKF
jgi:TonB-linked SusC/RagA family outer membrane protein